MTRTSRKLAVVLGAIALTIGGGATAIAATTGTAAVARHGADDPANHDANDDKGGRHGGHGSDD